ncbi:hypothetical protein BJ085DRAFT_40608 [Dimargaris cristalligena]|uniref:Uncharacterized protein n=1 Tax=Dimargaris cristalligena TaxID=215637 RepID=A0A4P9ZYD5_9FUNG|nr:hypothetical protein BJ085DRAFT_40608 [Dimargaris cristalligena]|eukprot:RKP38765.1 hypothetical protein BJ085DRAFT_40608 [Dimargaris cristalligena]
MSLSINLCRYVLDAPRRATKGPKVTLNVAHKQPGVYANSISFDIAPAPVAGRSDSNSHPLSYSPGPRFEHQHVENTQGMVESPTVPQDQITLTNVDHWAALVSETDVLDGEDNGSIKLLLGTSPESVPAPDVQGHQSINRPPTVAVSSPIQAPEPERKIKLPVQRRQKLIEEENERLRYQKMLAQRAELRQRRQEERLERERQDRAITGIMADRRIVHAFEKTLPVKHDWDRMERERIRLIGSVLGVHRRSRATGSGPVTPSAPYAATSPLPGTPHGFAPTSPMDIMGSIPTRDPFHRPATSPTSPRAPPSHLSPDLRPDGNDDIKGKYLEYVAHEPTSAPLSQQPSPADMGPSHVSSPILGYEEGPSRSAAHGGAFSFSSNSSSPHITSDLGMMAVDDPPSSKRSSGELSEASTTPRTDSQPLQSTLKSAASSGSSRVDCSALAANIPIVASGPIEDVEMEYDTEEGELVM